MGTTLPASSKTRAVTRVGAMATVCPAEWTVTNQINGAQSSLKSWLSLSWSHKRWRSLMGPECSLPCLQVCASQPYPESVWFSLHTHHVSLTLYSPLFCYLNY